MKKWYESFTFLDAPDGDPEVPVECYVVHRSAPHQISEDLKTGDICPECHADLVVPTEEIVKMPKSATKKEVKAELKCPRCTTLYWSEEQ